MNTKLQEIISGIPLLKQITGTDAAIGVWDKDAVLQKFFQSKGLDVYFEDNYKIEDKNDRIFEVLRTGVQVYNKVGKEAFGKAFEGTITPVWDGNEIVGAITYCYSAEEKDEIIANTEELTNSLEHTDESIEEIKAGTKELTINMTKVQEITELVRAQVREATNVVDTIQRNAKYSNILALNAAIESARVGQAGKGFAVVSDEMRKFAKISGDSAQMINGNLEAIVKSLNEVTKAIQASAAIASEQAEAANHLNEQFDSVIESAQKVNDICKNTAVR